MTTHRNHVPEDPPAIQMYERRLRNREPSHDRLMKDADTRLERARDQLESARQLYEERIEDKP